MKSILYISLTVFAFLLHLNAGAAPARQAEIQVVDDLEIQLVTERGNSTSILTLLPPPANLPEGEVAQQADAKFRYAIPKEFRNYDSWVLEIKDPKRNLSYKVSLEGQMPKLLHWDGSLGDNSPLEGGSQYFYKLYLYFADKTISSQWNVFSAYVNAVEENKDANEGIKLSVASSGGVHGMMLQTSKFHPILFPNLHGDIKFYLQSRHTVGVRFDATSNILFNATPNRTGFFYSDYSLFYRFRILGKPPMATTVPVAPAYASSRFRSLIPNEGNRMPTSLEIGVRAHSTVIRGFGNETIDPELAREFSGVAGSLHASHSLGDFRLHALAEFGYSMFKGAIMEMGFEGALTYERFASFSPGINFHLTKLSGMPAEDPFDGAPINGRTTPIENSLYFVGAIINFKL